MYLCVFVRLSLCGHGACTTCVGYVCIAFDCLCRCVQLYMGVNVGGRSVAYFAN